MAALRGIADIGALAVVAVFVGEYAVENEKLLAQPMLMGRKRTGRRIAHQRRRPRHLAADAVEEAAIDAGLRRRDPRQRIGCDHDTAGEVGIDAFVHGFALP